MKKHDLHTLLRMLLLAALMLAAAAFLMTACAEEEITEPNVQPGLWAFVGDTDDSNGEEYVELAYLFLEEDGTMALCALDKDYEYRYTCSGTWNTELVTDPQSVYCYADRLTLTFTASTAPQHAGSAYDVECVWYVYSESWIEYDCRKTALIIAERECTGVSPIAELCEEEDAGQFYRTEIPNMQVYNCKSYVSLRETPSTKATRLIKVPLGAYVFAFPEVPEQNGFLRCAYHDYEGYILAEYLT